MENLPTINTNEVVTDETLLLHLTNLGLIKDLTDGEKNSYLQIAKSFNLNPFKREIHVSKYNGQMSIITGYEVYLKRAERTGLLDGWECTTTGSVINNDLKATIIIYRKDRKYPFKHKVLYSEYVQRTNSGNVTKFWQKAITMTKKVAMSQGFRLCFSDELGGMPYTKEEMPEQETINVSHEIVNTIEVTPEPFQTLEEKIIDAERKLNDATSIESLNSIYKSFAPEIRASEKIIELAKQIKAQLTNE